MGLTVFKNAYADTADTSVVEAAALIWGGIAVLLILVELFVLDLTFLLLGVSAGGAALTAASGAPVPVQVAVFTALALLGVLAVRPIARKHMRLTRVTKTNVDALSGKTAKALTEITIDGGLVHLDGEQWTARLDRDLTETPISEGTEVIVTRIDGATALVFPNQ